MSHKTLCAYGQSFAFSLIARCPVIKGIADSQTQKITFK